MEVKINQKQLNLDVKNLNNKLEKQVTFATAKALTNVAWDCKRAVDKQMPTKIDRPTPFTKRAVGVARATAKTLISRVFIKDIQAEYLHYQVSGGSYSKQTGKVSVPVGAKRNKYGSMSKNYISRMMKRADTFIGDIKGVNGLYQRTRDGGVKLLVAFKKKVKYDRDRLPFYTIVEKTYNNRIQKRFKEALAYAFKTAK